MQRGRVIPEAVSKGSRTVSTRSRLNYRHQNGRLATSTAYANRRQQHFFRSVVAVAFAGGVATASQYYLNNNRFVREGHAETLEETELQFEQSKKRKGASKEEIRDLISSQHLQVKRSWENPGVYAWGSNAGRVVAPDSTEAFIKTPRRMKWFDNQLLRDLKLDKMFGAAIDEYGNLLQWGTAYAQDCMAPAKTLRGKDLVSLSVSRDRIIALSSSGKVYSVPVSREDQEAGSKPSEASWIPFWNGKSPISYRKIAPKDLAWNEKVTKVTSGLEHMLMITNKGRIFSAAAASDSFPARGQLGIPGLTWLTKPDGPYDMAHEIKTLKGFEMTDIACGDYHSLALDKEGRVFGFGDNSSGQLGFEYSSEANAVDVPTLLPTTKLYSGSSQTLKVTSLAAGGSNSYFTIDATKVAPPGATAEEIRGVGRVSADTFSFGSGIWGNLGNGRWTHVQSTPTKIPSLSSLFEYDEIKNQTIPIRLAYLSVGATHAAAVMDNVTYMDASAKSSENDTNWGADIVFWGNNEFFQLGTGKRNNVSTPTYIQPLDQVAERKVRGKEEHRFHITPRKTVRLGDGRKRSIEQRVECGRGCTAVYSKA
ncbi:mitochondrial protein-like protein Fmp25 [Elsinoe ampelina]|uniref:Mitochondrial protein-like protein Fmp25 n=1 Tax=Elsinoe ampelina TaxID=302913 RepID=A0A6A6GFH1_9PEZI|nr:mitochondrial protein-like protein Fmp25 [Elsinoe ampelina]